MKHIEERIVRTEIYPTGRKFCCRCKRWRQLHEFYAQKSVKGHYNLRSSCRTCDRVESRRRMGLKERGRAYEPTTGYPYGRQRMGDHCWAGHPLTPENLYVSPTGERRCRACKNLWEKMKAYGLE
mgnify:CR=1 FL=1